MAILMKLSNTVYNIEKVLLSASLFIIFFSLTLEVLFRYFLNMPLEWSGELAMYSLVWTTFIGGSMTIKDKSTINITILTDRLNPSVKKVIRLITQFIVMLFSLFIFIYSLLWITSPNTLFERSLALDIPMFIPYLGVPIGFGFMTIHSVVIFISNLASPKDIQTEVGGT